MLKNLIVLQDGTELFSGGPGGAITRLTLTQSVNSREELTLGSACASMLEAQLLMPEGVQIREGDSLTLYKVDHWGVRHQVGIFLAQRPVRTGTHRMKLTAFDRMVCMDRDITEWLSSLTQWPYTLQELAQEVCRVCGVELSGDPLPNGGYPVARFEAVDITGRELLQWIGEAAGRFCRADSEGRLRFEWYTPTGHMTLGPEFCPGIQEVWQDGHLQLTLEGSISGDQQVTLTGTALTVRDDGKGNVILLGPDRQYYFMGSMEKADYTVEPIARVQIRQNSRDVGVVYPDTPGQVNTYVITGNPLLTAYNTDALLEIARTLYTQLHEVCYTPCKVSLPATMELQPGHILQVIDTTGRGFPLYIMQKKQAGQRDTLEATGGQTRENTTAVNQRQLRNLTGKVLELQTDLEGLKAENADAAGHSARLELDIEGIRGQVQLHAQGLEQVTKLRQDAHALELQVQKLSADAGQVITSTGYTFGDDGLRIAKQGQEMESQVDHTGLYVRRSGQLLLCCGSRGVTASDVTVENYLVVGSHARFEDYGEGTACFYI